MIKPIETFYKGYRFRSRLEARWAVFFDALGVEWEYEPEGFVLDDGTCYLPDFRLKCWGTRGDLRKNPFPLYVEVKGEMSQEDADKIRKFSGVNDLWDICHHRGGQMSCADCGIEVHDDNGAVIGFRCPDIMTPILVVSNIPEIEYDGDVYQENIFGSYEEMNGCSIYPFNYELIDGDYFAAYPAATSEGKFYLWGDDCNYINTEDIPRVFKAYISAKRARFEYGENGG